MAEKRAYKMGTCADCGGRMKKASDNQRYCSTCRLGRAAQWHDGRTSKCAECGQDYIAWTGVRSWPHCGACLMARSPMGLRESVEGACARRLSHGAACRSPDLPTWLYTADFRLCFPCLTDPDHYAENRRLILKKVEVLRRRLNRGTVVGKR